MTTVSTKFDYHQWKADWLRRHPEDRTPIRGSGCKHLWVRHEWGGTYYDDDKDRIDYVHVLVFCPKCERRPHCAPRLFDSGQRQRHTHSPGESERDAAFKAGICRAMGEPDCKPVLCKHCGFWTIK